MRVSTHVRALGFYNRVIDEVAPKYVQVRDEES